MHGTLFVKSRVAFTVDRKVWVLEVHNQYDMQIRLDSFGFIELLLYRELSGLRRRLVLYSWRNIAKLFL
jgi:hypothetical protein